MGGAIRKAEQLHRALRDANIDKVRQIVRGCNSGALFAAYEEEYDKPVMYDAVDILATYRIYQIDRALDVKLSILEELVAAGADVNGWKISDSSTLERAMLTSNLPIFKLLIKLGADVNAVLTDCRPGGFDRTMLRVAVDMFNMYASPACLEYLLAHNAQPTSEDDELVSESALHEAFISAFVREMRFLERFMDWYQANNRPFPWFSALKRTCEFYMLVDFDSSEPNDVARVLWGRAVLSQTQIQELFLVAANSGFTYFMRMMINQHPGLLQSDWLVKDDIPEELKSKEHAGFLRWLKDVRSQPLQLEHICKLEILRALGPSPESRIASLPLPTALKNYLLEESKL
jgi:hypothetical protein